LNNERKMNMANLSKELIERGVNESKKTFYSWRRTLTCLNS
jgi:hypothetical protein